MSKIVFQIEEVTVKYGFRTVVDRLSLELSEGVSLGLLGPNGAGKTSTIKTLLGFVRPKTGNVKLFGGRTGYWRNFLSIGFAPEEYDPPSFLTGGEFLNFVAQTKLKPTNEIRRVIADLLMEFELDPTKKIGEYSKGMKRRLILAQAFLGDPRLIILDEPQHGLDPLMTLKLREKLLNYIKNGGTLLYSSHILSEVEKTCNKIAIFNSGKLCCFEDLKILQNNFGSLEETFKQKLQND